MKNCFVSLLILGAVGCALLPGAEDRAHLAHLKSIIVPSFALTNAPINDAVDALRYASDDFDPRRSTGRQYGFGFIAHYPPDYTNISISLSETNATLYDLIQKCCKQANMTFQLRHGGVFMEKKSGQPSPAPLPRDP